MAGFKVRVLSSVVLVLLLGSALWIGGPYLWLLLLFASEVGLFEFYRAMRPEEKRQGFAPDVLEITGFAGCFLYYLLLLKSESLRYPVFLLVGILILMMIVYVIRYPAYGSDHLIRSFFALIYVCVMLSFVYLTREAENGRKIVWMIFISSWICDTCAYLVGIMIGKHKLAPKLSPKKSIEGSVGGVIGAAAVGYLFGRLFGEPGVAAGYLLVSAAGAVISQFGDLMASAIKRDHKIKDYGTLIPGHGGILDRFDSVIITAPVIYILSQLILGTVAK